MADCPYCLEKIKQGAKKCPHCQSALDGDAATANSTVYVVDKGLLRFGKFALALLAIFTLIGLYLFGYDIKEAGQKAAEAELTAQKALVALDAKMVDLEKKIGESNQTLARVVELEIQVAGHRQKMEASAREVKSLVAELRGQRQEAGEIVVELRRLSTGQTQVAVAKRQERGIETDRGKLWGVGSTIKYRFMDGTTEAKDLVRTAISAWSDNVNLDISEVESGAAEIRVSFKESGSWSFVGTDSLAIPENQPTLNYGTIADLGNKDEAMRVVTHEFGHALGLVHEYQNPAAGEVFDRAALEAYFGGPPNNWDKATVEQNFLAKPSYPGARDYDSASIMNYTFDKSVFKPGKETKPGFTLSESDKSYIASLYPD
ncbi:MAG: matrixin family metalloprotease [Rhizobiales bacterium]|nr:matrixin family metalloprotease [Hyphomicrobiales bacterium]